MGSEEWSTRRVTKQSQEMEPDVGPHRQWGGVWVLF